MFSGLAYMCNPQPCYYPLPVPSLKAKMRGDGAGDAGEMPSNAQRDHGLGADHVHFFLGQAAGRSLNARLSRLMS